MAGILAIFFLFSFFFGIVVVFPVECLLLFVVAIVVVAEVAAISKFGLTNLRPYPAT